jgi:hypothetical protein
MAGAKLGRVLMGIVLVLVILSFLLGSLPSAGLR